MADNALYTLPTGQSVFSLNEGETSYLYQEIFEQRIYIPPGGIHLPDAPVIYDVGANIGMFSLFCKQEWPNAYIYALEPVPDVYEVLQKNLANVPDTNAYDVAVSDTIGTASITYYPRFTIMSGLAGEPLRDMEVAKKYALRQARLRYDQFTCNEIAATLDHVLMSRFTATRLPCKLTTLSALIREADCGRVDLLKLDVEGSEVAALRGLDKQTWPTVRNVVAEVTDDSQALTKVRKLLSEQGMEVRVWQHKDYEDTNQFLVFGSRDCY